MNLSVPPLTIGSVVAVIVIIIAVLGLVGVVPLSATVAFSLFIALGVARLT